MSKFQISVLAIFVLAIVGGVIAFATFKSDSSDTSYPSITIWGTLPQDVFTQYVGNINNTLSKSLRVTYVQKSADSFSEEFVSALARGIGPDAILISADMLLPQINKLVPIPYTAFSQRNFMDTYIQEAQIYIADDGLLAIPFVVDPLVMYWNKDSYSTAGLASYPKTWGEFADLTGKMTVKDQNGNIRKSTVALGTFNNIKNARETLGTLILQLGNPITARKSDSSVENYLETGNDFNPETAVTFYSKFANPSDKQYSWNRSLVDDKTSFLAGNLATYFGFASELFDIRSKNANLNFDVAPMPQIKGSTKSAVYGKLYGFSIVKASPNANGAYQTIMVLNGDQALLDLSAKMYLPPVKTTLMGASSDPYIQNFEKAALISKTWLDVDPAKSKKIFGDMIDAVTSGRKRIGEAIQDAGDEYQLSIDKAIQ